MKLKLQWNVPYMRAVGYNGFLIWGAGMLPIVAAFFPLDTGFGFLLFWLWWLVIPLVMLAHIALVAAVVATAYVGRDPWLWGLAVTQSAVAACPLLWPLPVPDTVPRATAEHLALALLAPPIAMGMWWNVSGRK